MDTNKIAIKKKSIFNPKKSTKSYSKSTKAKVDSEAEYQESTSGGFFTEQEDQHPINSLSSSKDTGFIGDDYIEHEDVEDLYQRSLDLPFLLSGDYNYYKQYSTRSSKRNSQPPLKNYSHFRTEKSKNFNLIRGGTQTHFNNKPESPGVLQNEVDEKLNKSISDKNRPVSRSKEDRQIRASHEMKEMMKEIDEVEEEVKYLDFCTNKNQYSLEFLENSAEEVFESFQTFINWVPQLSLLATHESSIYLSDSYTRKTVKIDKNKFIESLIDLRVEQLQMYDDPQPDLASKYHKKVTINESENSHKRTGASLSVLPERKVKMSGILKNERKSYSSTKHNIPTNRGPSPVLEESKERDLAQVALPEKPSLNISEVDSSLSNDLESDLSQVDIEGVNIEEQMKIMQQIQYSFNEQESRFDEEKQNPDHLPTSQKINITTRMEKNLTAAPQDNMMKGLSLASSIDPTVNPDSVSSKSDKDVEIDSDVQEEDEDTSPAKFLDVQEIINVLSPPLSQEQELIQEESIPPKVQEESDIQGNKEEEKDAQEDNELDKPPSSEPEEEEKANEITTDPYNFGKLSLADDPFGDFDDLISSDEDEKDECILLDVKKEDNPKSTPLTSTLPHLDLKEIVEGIEDLKVKNRVSDVISKLQEALKSSQIELRKSQKSIESIENSGLEPLDMARNKLHFGFLFASPLARNYNGKIVKSDQLDFKTEIEDILYSLKDLSYNLNYKVSLGTREHLRRTVIECPIALHFSGHGAENNKNNLGNTSMLFKEKGNVLFLEDSTALADYYYQTELEALVKARKTNFEVVFVSSCQSEFAGRIFLNAGAKHVICIRQADKVDDLASLKFSSVFYEHLFGKAMSVCEAFDISQKVVKSEINPVQARMFMLLTQKDNPKSKLKKHICSSIQNLDFGSLNDVSDYPLFDYVPDKVEEFMCREIEMHQIAKSLNCSKVVTVIGPAGIGKTSIARSLANFYRERRTFRDGVIYVKLRGITSSQMFLTQLSLSIRASTGDIEIEALQNVRNPIEPVMKKYYSTVQDKQDKTINMLKNRKVLLILDNCEDVINNDHENFIYELENLLEACHRVKILTTSRKPLSELVNNKEVVFPLYPLSNRDTLELMKQKCKNIRHIPNKELRELKECNIPEGSRMGQHLNVQFNLDSGSLLKKSDVQIENHPFIQLLGGHPQAISLIVSLLRDCTLKELFLTFCDSNMIDVVHDNSALGSQATSLKVTLDLSITQLREKNHEALDLFCLIGLLPSGVSKEEITQIWGDNSWKKLKNELIDSSLIIEKNSMKEPVIYYMLPFMSERACEILEENKQLQSDYHLKCCTLYKSYCYKFYKSEKNFKDKERLASMESNIWACIYRAFERSKKAKSLTNNEQFESPNLSSVSFTREEKKDEITASSFSFDSKANDIDLAELKIDIEMYRLFSKFEEDQGSELRYNIVTKTEWEPEDFMYIDETQEEFLIVYYATSLILMEKFDDASRAINGYICISNISDIAKANLERMQAFLYMIRDDYENSIRALQLLRSALKIFQSLKLAKGVAICQLGISKIFHDNYDRLVAPKSTSEKEEFETQWKSLVMNCADICTEIGFEEGLKVALEISDPKSSVSGYESILEEGNFILLNVILKDDKE
ncbi:unnamed protein product [Moneuplotes crassus]|uniref:AAA+ ATPase domain-containing protein n=1 Tax=Euplotes crassus TaxID=5936 RepID=A0AAD1XXQ7_EUPCR|nr:unnamed protein product [Moneuplotes crassus]